MTSIKQKKEKKYKYTCTRCGDNFTIYHKVDKKGALCTPCFKGLLKIKTAKDYNSYLHK